MQLFDSSFPTIPPLKSPFIGTSFFSLPPVYPTRRTHGGSGNKTRSCTFWPYGSPPMWYHVQMLQYKELLALSYSKNNQERSCHAVDAPFKACGAARLINYCSHTWSSLDLAMDGATPFVRCTKASNSQAKWRASARVPWRLCQHKELPSKFKVQSCYLRRVDEHGGGGRPDRQHACGC